ncbi:MAG: PASTA domain-containing protein [Candidatus Latescibacterota bacterium]|nr:PASTA domain-containing protein [Candidatus Latescibacterota bacterium]
MKNILRHLGLIIAAAALAGIIGLILLDAVVMPYIVDVPSVRVPNLQGLSVPNATVRLERSGLGMAIGDSLHHETIPPNAVVDQDPTVGHRVKKGRRIVVIPSKGARYYDVPDVRRVSLREARLQLEGNQLQIGQTRYLSSATIPEGAIVGQSPSPGARLSRGSSIDLQISSGSPTTPKRIPNLVGLSIEVVEDTLRKYELRLGQIENRIDNQQPVGTVLAQTPDHRRHILRRSRIDLVLSVEELPPIPTH